MPDVSRISAFWSGVDRAVITATPTILPDSTDKVSTPRRNHRVLVLWWAAWLGFNLIGLLGRSSTANDVHALTVADEWQLISVLLGIASAVLAVVVVRAVVRRQQSGIQAWPGAPLAIPLPPPPAPGPLPG